MHYLWGELKLLGESNENAYDYVRSKHIFFVFCFKDINRIVALQYRGTRLKRRRVI